MSIFERSLYAYDPNELEDLDDIFNEESSQLISLSSIDDNQLDELTRSLVTPTPNKYRATSSPYAESVQLFRNLKDTATVDDLVHSDLREFMDHYDMDDLLSSRPTSSIKFPSRTTNIQDFKTSTRRNTNNEDRKSQLLSALEQSYIRERQMEQVYLDQLKEIDSKAYERLKRDSEAFMKRRSSLLQHFRNSCEPSVPRYTLEKTSQSMAPSRSSGNSTTTSSSHSNDVYYDPPSPSSKRYSQCLDRNREVIFHRQGLDEPNIDQGIIKKNVPDLTKSPIVRPVVTNYNYLTRTKRTNSEAQERPRVESYSLRRASEEQPRGMARRSSRQQDDVSRARRMSQMNVESYLAHPRRISEDSMNRSRRTSEDNKYKTETYLARPRASVHDITARPREDKTDRDIALSYLNRAQKRDSTERWSLKKPVVVNEPRVSTHITQDKLNNRSSLKRNSSVEDIRKRLSYLSTDNKRYTMEPVKTEKEMATESAKRVLAMVQERRSKRLSYTGRLAH
ncbi:hypothetical protein G6F70_008539 [Rhizopus microsporus]|uniref:Uncharacterized protein n=2 Tax=Rhizopus TaxID=4842 RepID=A0A367JB85_RHIAZ|nr:hypothetical protein G6F71_005810 [Rhizopus microsporus]KAG1195037.1 hypothetical protein G6F70_008539 [Rhizopus microsporus]KAG1210405.1 hypothetical protein G6F69_005515 [Rhizopus microsporus]ORE18462.1 hypothetical protein BCV71DRAFT_290819 [Rhizopus microsporus]RCH87188.1 hypothetical protein CU097_006620 [Rhizopus azygosporus]